MGRRTIAILLLVGGLLLLLVVAGFLLLQEDEPPTDDATAAPVAEEDVTAEVDETPAAPEADEAEVAEGPLVEVVVSLQTVPRGWQMTEAELTTDLRRAELVGENVITDIDDAIGRYARTDIFQGQTLTEDSLVGDPTLAGVEEYGPSSLIPEGYVAQAVPMDRLSSVDYSMAAGDLIDVMITFHISEVDPEFQTLLPNSAVFQFEETAVGVDENGETITERPEPVILDPFGRFETLPNGDLAFTLPSEPQRPLRIGMIVQAAKVIQVGPWVPQDGPQTPTPTPTPNPEATPTPEAGTVPTATPTPPDVVLLALSPQQQLLLRYAIETGADIDYAIRSVEDGQIYGVQNVDFRYLLDRFDIDVPLDFEYTAEQPILVTVTPTPLAGEETTTPADEQ
jgi:Flp pilus assembly protein CpaB